MSLDSMVSAKCISGTKVYDALQHYISHRFNIPISSRIPNDQYVAFGELKHGKNCLEVNGLRDVMVDECSNDATRWFFNQSGALSIQTQNCLTFDAGELRLMHCQLATNQMWLRKRGNLIHLSTGKCLENIHESSVVLSPCRRGAQSQIWNFSVEIEELAN